MDDLKYIKKHYGEKMMHMCRTMFPTILDTPGALSEIMDSCFVHSRVLYYDIEKYMLETRFKNYIYKNYNMEERKAKYTSKTPEELLEEVDYKLYECKTEEDIQKFKKYYKEGEELCTFLGGRLYDCFVFFAVKNNAEELKREDFKKPRREDDYGISVISIQFSRDNYTLSIKNRYNHTVYNPDATYGNNLDNIIPGLTNSFEKKYNFRIKQNRDESFEMPGYVEVDGKIYNYNYEINNKYYCPNNIIIENGKITQYPQEQYIIMDYYVFDIRNKRIDVIDRFITDGLIDEYKNIERIEIRKEPNRKNILITTKEKKQSIITVNNQNQIIEYKNNNIEEVKGGFMGYNETLRELQIPNAKRINNSCFKNCKALEKLYLPNAYIIEIGSFNKCESLKELQIPKLTKINSYCFQETPKLEKINLENVIEVEDNCFEDSRTATEINAPYLIKIGNHSFRNVKELTEVSFPNVETMGEYTFYNANSMRKIDLPKLKNMDSNCFNTCDLVKELELLNLETMGGSCFVDNNLMEKVNLPKAKIVNRNCFRNSKSLKEINLPETEEMGDCCFMGCGNVEIINISKLTHMNNNSFSRIESVKKLYTSSELDVDKKYFFNKPIKDTIFLFEPFNKEQEKNNHTK